MHGKTPKMKGAPVATHLRGEGHEAGQLPYFREIPCPPRVAICLIRVITLKLDFPVDERTGLSILIKSEPVHRRGAGSATTDQSRPSNDARS